MDPRIVIVAIGRNEGARLGPCLSSVLGQGAAVVYVDSGSTDGSPDTARRAGAAVLELDRSKPFTAARARNEGLERAVAIAPAAEFVQFVDADCVMHPEWLSTGVGLLGTFPEVAAVCGRVRERNREGSVYNRLCDLEWDSPPGETNACGGNALYRVAAFREAGGFLQTLIGGEEGELCLRLRRSGRKIRRAANEMVVHDAAMTQFSQWWRRALRSGWAYAELTALHGTAVDCPWRRENQRILLWGALLPMAAVLLAWPTRGRSLLLLAMYPLHASRLYARERRDGRSSRDARIQSFFLTLAKFPQVVGQIQFALRKQRAVVDWRTG